MSFLRGLWAAFLAGYNGPVDDLEGDDVFKRSKVGDRQTALDWVICIEENPGGGKRAFVVSVRYMEHIHVNYVGSFMEVATFVADTMYKHRAEVSPEGNFYRDDVGEWQPIELDEGVNEFAVDAARVVRSEVATEGDELDVLRKRRRVREM